MLPIPRPVPSLPVLFPAPHHLHGSRFPQPGRSPTPAREHPTCRWGPGECPGSPRAPSTGGRSQHLQHRCGDSQTHPKTHRLSLHHGKCDRGVARAWQGSAGPARTSLGATTPRHSPFQGPALLRGGTSEAPSHHPPPPPGAGRGSAAHLGQGSTCYSAPVLTQMVQSSAKPPQNRPEHFAHKQPLRGPGSARGDGGSAERALCLALLPVSQTRCPQRGSLLPGGVSLRCPPPLLP